MPRTDEARIIRNKKIVEYLDSNPFATDEELSKYFNVSVNTIRLDRARLGIKELRERIKDRAEENIKKIVSLSKEEIIGDIIELIPGQSGISMMKTQDYMSFENTDVIKGYHIYSMAESIAIGIIPTKVALVGIANIKYVKKITRGETIYAKAEIKKKRETNYIVWVQIYGDNKEAKFKGKFLLKEIK